MKVKVKNIFLISFIFGIMFSCHSQGISYKKLPDKYGKYFKREQIPKELLNHSISIIKYLPKEVTEEMDLTPFIQKAINENNVVIIPKGTYRVTGLKLKSNFSLLFEEGAELELIANNKERYEILSLAGIKNVKIYNPVLIGDIRKRNSLKGEWGFGIDIRGSREIDIYSPFIKDCLGDGIIISKSSKGLPNNIQLLEPHNIFISNAFIDYSGRNGISIIAGQNIKISSPIILNTFQKSPKSAIDIEPDHANHILNHILIDSLFSFNNVDGIMINLRRYVDEKNKETNIVINNHTDIGAVYPLNFPGLHQNKKHKKIRGEIVINNPHWIDNEHPMVRNNSNGLAPRIRINNPKMEGLKLKRWKNKDVESLDFLKKFELHIKDKSDIILKY